MAQVDVLSLFTQVARKIEGDRVLPEITRDAKITNLGIDSVSMMEIIGCIEDELDVTIPDERLATIQTVGDIEKAVMDRLGAGGNA